MNTENEIPWRHRHEKQFWSEGLDDMLDAIDKCDHVEGLRFRPCGSEDWDVEFIFCGHGFAFMASDEGEGFGYNTERFSVQPLKCSEDVMTWIALKLAERLEESAKPKPCTGGAGTTHYAGCACHEQGWQDKWDCAVEMAAQAAATLHEVGSRLLRVHKLLASWKERIAHLEATCDFRRYGADEFRASMGERDALAQCVEDVTAILQPHAPTHQSETTAPDTQRMDWMESNLLTLTNQAVTASVDMSGKPWAAQFQGDRKATRYLTIREAADSAMNTPASK